MGIWRCKNCYGRVEVGWAEGPKPGTDYSLLPTESSPWTGLPQKQTQEFFSFAFINGKASDNSKSSHKEINISAA